jgi:amidase
MSGTLNAFVDEALTVSGAADGALAGTIFAAKDLYDVADHASICGNPDWGRTHRPATAHAAVVQSLLDAGATLRGKTITDEFAFSIVGENHHHGTPMNPNAPGRTCGGSSSGSAAAVAGGLVDFSLGTDTGGSVRVPAGFCGVFGLRPTHGRVSLAGVFPLAPSFDTAGWFARDPALLRDVGTVLLDGGAHTVGPPRLLYPTDVWAVAEPATVEALARGVAAMEDRFGAAAPMELTDGEGLAAWFEVFRVAQGAEIWRTLGPWIEATRPTIGPGIKERLDWCASISDEEAAAAETQRARIAARVAEVTADGAMLVMPITPGAALPAGRAAVTSNEVRARLIQLSGIAPLAKVPQISLPIGRHPDGPVALSVMTGQGGDERLLDLATTLCGVAEGGAAPIL